MNTHTLNGLRRVTGPLMALLSLALTPPVLAADLLPREVGAFSMGSAHPASFSVQAVEGARVYGIVWEVDAVSGYSKYTLKIVDVANPSSPQLLGSLLVGKYNIGHAAVSGNYVYLAAQGENGGLIVIDVSNPATPRRVARLPTFQAYDVFLVGNYAYVADAEGLIVVDISDPTHPRRAGRLGGAGEATAVFVSGHYAYLAINSSPSVCLRIVDINDPTHPQLVAESQQGDTGWYVGVVGNIAYVGASLGLEMFDVSDPANPMYVASYGRSGWGGSLPGGRAYTTGWQGLTILDLSDPISPKRIGGYPASCVVSGRYAYGGGISEYGGEPGFCGLRIIDLDPPANLPRLGDLDTAGSARDVAISGTRAYMADDTAGVQVLDIADPAKPVWLGNFSTAQPAAFVAASGNYAYVVETWYNGGGSSGSSLEILDVSNPAAPQWVGAYETSGGASSFTVAGNHAYLGLSEFTPAYRVEVIDLSAPANPLQVGMFDTDGKANGLAVSGHQLFVANAGVILDPFGPHVSVTNAGVTVLDIADPANPRLIGSTTSSNSVNSVAVSGARAYVAHSGGFQIFDLNDPAHPSLLGASTNFGSGWSRLAVSGNNVYAAAGNAGVQVVDISDSANPRLVGGNSAAMAKGLAISGNRIFVAGEIEGLQVFDLALSIPPAPPVLKTTQSGSKLTLAWPASAKGSVLESTGQLDPAPAWSSAPERPVMVGDEYLLTVDIGAGARFFRLRVQ